MHVNQKSDYDMMMIFLNSGDHCETDIIDCVADPCGSNGDCEEGVNGYHCDCDEGYTGTHCEVILPCFNFNP